MRDKYCLMEWWRGVMGFTCRVYIKWLKIYRAAGFAIFLCADNHSVAPCYSSLIGTGSITPSRTSWSSLALISSCQCIGTGTDEWWATGLASGSTIRRGVISLVVEFGVRMCLKCWTCSGSVEISRSLSRLLSVAANGSVVGSSVGSWRVGHWQFCVSWNKSVAIIF